MRKFVRVGLVVGLMGLGAGLSGVGVQRVAMGAVEKVEEGKTARATFEVYQDKKGEWRWRLRAKNTQVIATSGQGYGEKRACLAGIESVRKDVADAPVKEVDAAGEKGEAK